ncbi:MAG: ferritin [Acidimicrobiia bacterium]|nr:ferritin [Acidimicrobiia bacterium]
MKITDKLVAAYSDQVTMELASSNAYLQMSAWFDRADLPGMASWMRIQSDEERLHALRFIDFVLDRGNQVAIGEAPAPEKEFSTARSVFEAALANEQKVSAAIRDLYHLASSEGDVESFALLEWFLTEQIEEEATVDTILGQLSHAGDDGSALLLLDRELGARNLAAEPPA